MTANLNDVRVERGLTWQQVSYALSELTRGEYGEDYLHPHRLWKLRTDKAKPRGYELKALWEWGGLDSFVC